MFRNLAGKEYGDSAKIDKLSSMDKKKVVFVLGPPGVGKGTQCQKISEYYGFLHVSAGELLRNECQVPDSKHGKLIDSCMKNGKIVPSEITCKLLEKCLMDSDRNCLIDGFPRNEENRKGWDKIIGDKVEVLFVILFECPTNVCIERCLTRGSGRFDDTNEILTKRIITHLEETYPVIDYYTEKNLLKVVNGNRSEDDVFGEIKRIFESYNFSPINNTQ